MNPRTLPRLSVLFVAKWLGLFRLSSWLTRRQLRILCYHGQGLEDTGQFMPGLFMSRETFRLRLQWLERRGVSILPLDTALDLLDQGRLPPKATVITIDDGFYSTYQIALEELEKLNFPATIYVCTYYAVKEEPLFNLVVKYMFWKTRLESINLSALGLDLSASVFAKGSRQAGNVLKEIIQHGQTHCTQSQRGQMMAQLGGCLEIDYGHIASSRMLSLMNRSEIKDAAARGFDIQLHAHRHRLPQSEDETVREIVDNRLALESIVSGPLVDFCYPGGIWSPRHWPWLEAEGVRSATTCDPGLNSSKTPKLALKRFIDGEDVPQIIVDAYLSGFAEVLRQVRQVLKFGR